MKASGNVYRSGGKEGISHATIKASKGNQIVYATADDGGDFLLDIPEPGTWEFMALDKGSFAGKPNAVDMSQDQSDIKIYLDRITDTEDDKAGKTFFWTLMGIFAVLIVVYLLVHFFVKEAAPPLSGASVDSLAQLRQQIDASQDITKDDDIKTAITNLDNDLETALGRTNSLDTADRDFVSTVIQDVQDSVNTGQKERALSLLDDLQRVIVPSTGFKFWSDDPLRFLEIVLWGLAGILVSKIFTTGWYLRNRRFYREGILMHIAHIATTPLLVLITVLLLSLVTMKFTLANSNEITVDLSDARIMVAFAFIIGTSPWPLWNFILNTAKRFTGQLG
jgi:hypothetical protein